MPRWTLVLLPVAFVVALAGADGPARQPLLFEDDFTRGADRWKPTDPKVWKVIDTRQGKAAGHPVVGSRVVKDEPTQIRAAMEEAARAGAQAIIVNGGTGIAARDRSYEAVAVPRVLLRRKLARLPGEETPLAVFATPGGKEA